jgi:hypothetical protein
MSDWPKKTPETEEEIKEAIAWLKQEGHLPYDNLRQYLATRQEFRSARGIDKNLDPDINSELRGLLAASKRRVRQENFAFRVGMWLGGIIFGGYVLVFLFAVCPPLGIILVLAIIGIGWRSAMK